MLYRYRFHSHPHNFLFIFLAAPGVLYLFFISRALIDPKEDTYQFQLVYTTHPLLHISKPWRLCGRIAETSPTLILLLREDIRRIMR